MNRQIVIRAQKEKNSTLLPASDILQRKLINRTEFETPAVDKINPVVQLADSPSFKVSESHFNHEFSNIPVRSNASFPIQAKLKIGQPNDKYEQEADRVADQVMRMPDPGLSSSVVDSLLTNSMNSRNKTIQRACASCSAEYKTAEDENRSVKSVNLCPKCRTQEQVLIQTKQITPLIQRQEDISEEEDEELIQAKTTGGITPELTPAISSGIHSLQGGGLPLSRNERSFFESRFGTDFSGVRVHNNTQAAITAKSFHARAFTLGHNVVFGAGEYSPDSVKGKKLLAHELTHVVQQTGSSVSARQGEALRKNQTRISSHAAARGEITENVLPVRNGTLQRKPIIMTELPDDVGEFILTYRCTSVQNDAIVKAYIGGKRALTNSLFPLRNLLLSTRTHPAQLNPSNDKAAKGLRDAFGMGPRDGSNSPRERWLNAVKINRNLITMNGKIATLGWGPGRGPGFAQKESKFRNRPKHICFDKNSNDNEEKKAYKNLCTSKLGVNGAGFFDNTIFFCDPPFFTLSPERQQMIVLHETAHRSFPTMGKGGGEPYCNAPGGNWPPQWNFSYKVADSYAYFAMLLGKGMRCPKK